MIMNALIPNPSLQQIEATAIMLTAIDRLIYYSFQHFSDVITLKRMINSQNSADVSPADLARFVFKLVVIHMFVMATITQWFLFGYTDSWNSYIIGGYLALAAIVDICVHAGIEDGMTSNIALALIRFFFYKQLLPVFSQE